MQHLRVSTCSAAAAATAATAAAALDARAIGLIR